MVTITDPAFCEPPIFIPLQVVTPFFFSSQWQVSKIAITFGLNFFANGTASWMWSKCP